MKSCLYSAAVRGQTKWIVDHEETGRRKCRFFPNKRSSELWAAELRSGLRSAKAFWATLPETDRERLTLAYHEAVERGQDLHD